MQTATESNANMANTQKSSMKTGKGVRPSSSRRKVVISDDPKRGNNATLNSTFKSMDSKNSKNKDSPTKSGVEGAGTTNLASTNNNTKNLLTKRQSKPAYL